MSELNESRQESFEGREEDKNSNPATHHETPLKGKLGVERDINAHKNKAEKSVEEIRASVIELYKSDQLDKKINAFFMLQVRIGEVLTAERQRAETAEKRVVELERWLDDAATACGGCDLDSVGNAVRDLRSMLDKMGEALERLLKFNEELCEDVGVSTHYPSADFGREALDLWMKFKSE